MTTPLVTFAVSDGVATVRLTDPEHRNALSWPLSEALADAVAAALTEGARALVLLSTPPVFCAGGSLQGLLARDVALEETYRGFLALAEAPIPTIVAVAGAAIGAGVNLALACDVVLTSPHARFDPRFLDVAIHPGGAHLWRLRQRIGDQGAAAMVLCGDVLTGEEAVSAGLAWRCFPEDQVEGAALVLAKRAAERSTALLRRTKASLRRSREILDPKVAFEMELEAQRWSMEQPEFESMVRATLSRIAAQRDQPPSTDHGPAG